MPQFSEKISLQLEFMRAKFPESNFVFQQPWRLNPWVFCNWVWSSGFCVRGFCLQREPSCARLKRVSPLAAWLPPSKIQAKHSQPDQTFNILFIFVFFSQPDEIAFSLSCNCRSSCPLFCLYVHCSSKSGSVLSPIHVYMPILTLV